MKTLSIAVVVPALASAAALPAAEPQLRGGSGSCAKYEVLVARGTAEPGTLGAIVGDPLLRATTKVLPGVKGIKIDYPAGIDIKKSGAEGEKAVVAHLKSQSTACPDTTFALVGYSQGAGVMHGAFKAENGLPETLFPKIKALVMFGDGGFKATKVASLTIPKFPTALQPRLLNNCQPGDPVCDPDGGSTKNHLKYRGDEFMTPAAAFLAKAFQGQPLPNSIHDCEDQRWNGGKGVGKFDSAASQKPPGDLAGLLGGSSSKSSGGGLGSLLGSSSSSKSSGLGSLLGGSF